jgi:beta-aspartyl-dipeptidase (metallo-type)
VVSAGLPETLRELVGRGYSLDQVLPSMTINVARLLRLENKGRIEAGADADFVCLGDALDVRHVMAGGQWMVQDQVPLVHGLFEE